MWQQTFCFIEFYTFWFVNFLSFFFLSFSLKLFVSPTNYKKNEVSKIKRFLSIDSAQFYSYLLRTSQNNTYDPMQYVSMYYFSSFFSFNLGHHLQNRLRRSRMMLHYKCRLQSIAIFDVIDRNVFLGFFKSNNNNNQFAP